MNPKRIIKSALVIVILVSFGLILYNNKEKYTTFDYWKRFPQLKKDFYGSQYFNKDSVGFTPDEHVYSFAGGALIQGENPILILPEAPPLGKYLIGLSAKLFNNENILIMPVAGIIGLVFMYLIGRQIYTSSITPLIPPLLVTLEPLYRNQYKYVPLFDIAHLMFLLISLYFFNKALTAKEKDLKWFIAAQIAFGCFISTKFYMAGITIAGAWVLVLLYNKNKSKLIKLFATFPISVFVLYLTYVRVLIIGYPFNRFLGIQRWIYNFWTGKLSLPFTVWPLIFLNQWYVWWGDVPILSDFQWQITWPVVTALSFSALALYILKKLPQKKEVEVILAFTLTYGAFASIGQTSARYLVIYLPILYLASTYLLEHIIISRRNKQKILR